MRQIAIALCCLVAAGSLSGIRGQQQAPPAFRGGVSLVTIDVTVLDREGKPVPGLTAADFQVKLNGRVQPIRALSFLEARTETVESAPQSKGPVMPQLFPVAEVAGEAAATGMESRVFVILVDDLSFPALGGRSLFGAAARFIAALPAADVVGFTTSSGAGAVSPTRERAPIAAALAKVVGEYVDPRGIRGSGGIGGKDPANSDPDQSVGISQALDIDRGDLGALKDAIVRECYNGDRTIFASNTVEGLLVSSHCASQLQVQARQTAAMTRQTTDRQAGAITAVINAMKVAGGIRHLVLLTAGVGVTHDVPSLEPVARAAAEAGIQLSVIVEEPGLSLTDTGRRDPGRPGVAAQADTGMSQRRREDNVMFVSGAHTLADMVGGAFYRVVGDADPFFRRVGVASSAVYRLAIEPPADTAPGREFSLVATVRRSGLTALANKRAMATSPAAASTATIAILTPAAGKAGTIEDQMRDALTSGRALSGVPISMVSGVRRAADVSRVEIGIRVRIPSAARGPLTAIFGVVDAAGKLRSGRKVIEPPPAGEDYGVMFSLPVTPGAYRLRFVVADASGRVGAVDAPIRAELSAMGPFAAGDLQTSWLDASEKEQAQFPALDEVPGAAATLAVSLELYEVAGAAVPRDVLVRIAFGPARQPPAIERVVAPVNDNGTWRAEAQFPLERVAPGAYSLEATVVIDGKPVGTRSSAIVKR